MKLIRTFVYATLSVGRLDDQAMWDWKVPHRAVLAVLMAVTASACTAQRAASVDSASPSRTYDEALHACQFRHTGKASRALSLDATEPHIAACLRRLGYEPGGAPASTPPAATPPDQVALPATPAARLQ